LNNSESGSGEALGSLMRLFGQFQKGCSRKSVCSGSSPVDLCPENYLIEDAEEDGKLGWLRYHENRMIETGSTA
jgi:hypothetical protein